MTAGPPLFWNEVVATALVGTDRCPITGGPVALLDAAAANGLIRRAGVRPASGVFMPEPAPAERAPTASRAATARLSSLLDPVTGFGTDGRNAEARLEMVDEWLEAGRLVPGELLPALLDLGRRHRRLRQALVTAGGERVRWLAAQREEWRYLLGHDLFGHDLFGSAAEGELSEPWDLAPIGQRVWYLSALRRRDPTGAVDLLASTWDTETAADRATFLRTLRIGQSTADEELLERALDDPRREVRSVALDLIGRLPESRYARRMTARARECLRATSTRVEVRPPAQCDQSMRRDGVTVRPPAGTGQRAWWLEEVLARTPLDGWGSPDDLLDRPIAEEWAGVVRRGLGRAAAAQADGVWAAALVDRLWPETSAGQRPDDRLLLEALYEALDVEQRAERAAAVLRRDPTRAAAVGVERLLELCPRPWSPALTDAVLETLSVLVRGGASAWRLTGLTALAGTRLPVTAVEMVVGIQRRLAAGHPHDPSSPLVDLVDVLRFRAHMLEELRHD